MAIYRAGVMSCDALCEMLDRVHGITDFAEQQAIIAQHYYYLGSAVYRDPSDEERKALRKRGYQIAGIIESDDRIYCYLDEAQEDCKRLNAGQPLRFVEDFAPVSMQFTRNKAA